MPMFEITSNEIRGIPETSFQAVGLRERQDLQRLLREQVAVISPDTMVIAEHFGDWEDPRNHIDLLGLDKDANLVVIELAGSEDEPIELQSIRYASLVSAMTFERAVVVHQSFLDSIGRGREDARAAILGFLGWDVPNDERFAQDVRIVLAASGFSRELTTAVLWLNERRLDIRCVRLKPYSYGKHLMLDVSQLIPLPDAEQYQVSSRVKTSRERPPAAHAWDQASFMRDLLEIRGEAEVAISEHLLEWSKTEADWVRWCEGGNHGAFVPILQPSPSSARQIHPFDVWSNGWIGIDVDALTSIEPLVDDLAHLVDALEAVPGLELQGDGSGRQRFPLSALSSSQAMAAFKEAASEFMRAIRKRSAELSNGANWTDGDRDV